MTKPENPVRSARRAALALVALVALVSAGCSEKIRTELIPNQAPQVRLTGAPVARDSLNPDFYAYTLQWVGYDPDGRVSHFVYAVDPPNPDVVNLSDTTWHSTARNEQTFFFEAAKPFDPINPSDPRSETPHVFAIYAVDDKGALSRRPAVRGFFSFTQCPIVSIIEPPPTSAFSTNVTPTTIIRWTGQDPDGQFTQKPVRWVFRLFGQTNADFPNIPDFLGFALTFPDSLRKLYAPESPGAFRNFRGWNSVGADTTSFQYRGLTPSSTYLFVVTGFDEAGAYDPVFSPGRNMLKFFVTFAGTAGPVIAMFNQFFFYEYEDGGYILTEDRWFKLEVPADLPITFNYFASPPELIRRYRWVLDLVDLTDQTQRSNEDTDWYHWSQWSRNTTQARIGPFTENNETHLFYLEAEDVNGLTSLGIIYFTVVRSLLDKELLFVDDTRMRPDYRSGSGQNVDLPQGPWPTAAELDSFLYARGGFPWKSYPAGRISQRGIFSGYAYDTIGTRGISLDGTVPLSLLGRYRHVVWYVDETGASQSLPPSHPAIPITALRLVNSPGRPVILATYLTQGGKVWLAGGGAGGAMMIPWNRAGTTAYEFTARDFELVPGRMMYDFVHWREGVLMLPAVQARRFGTTTFGVGTNRPGRHWPPNPIPPTPLNPPDYTLLPALLQPKTPATDPMSPWAPTRPPDANYYRGNYMAEAIHRATFIREDYNDDPEIQEEFSTLDTLYITAGGSSIPNSPVMTYYHGRENTALVFSGLNFWYWQRSQCIGLVDWVLQSVWGLPRDPVDRMVPDPPPPTSPMSARRAAP